MRFFLLISGVMSISALRLQAEQGFLELYARNMKGDALPGVRLSTQGPGEVSKPTDIAGRTRIKLALQTNAKDWVPLQVVPPTNLVFVSPWDQRALVPSFDNKPNNFVTVVLADRGDVDLLKSGAALSAITARMIAATSASLKKEAKSTEQSALDEVAAAFGLRADDVDKAIRAWKVRTSDPFEKALAAMYQSQYANASQLFSKSLEKRERALLDAQKEVFTAAYYLGVSKSKQQDFLSAEKGFQRAVTIEPNNDEALEWLAITLAKLHRDVEADAIFRRAVAVSGDDANRQAEILLSFARFLRSRNNLAEEEKMLERAYELAMNNDGEPQQYGEYLEALAEVLERRGKYNEAAERYRELFLGYLHPRERPSFEADIIASIIRVKRKGGDDIDPEKIFLFVLGDEEMGPEEREAVIAKISNMIQRQPLRKGK